MTGQSPRRWEGHSVQHKILQRHMDLDREKQMHSRAGNSSGQRRQRDNKVPEKGEGLHRLSLKRGKPTTSRRKYQKFIIVAKKNQQVHLQTLVGRVKADVCFYWTTSHVLKGAPAVFSWYPTLSHLEPHQPSAETTSTEVEILISSFPDCTSPSLGAKVDFLYKTKQPSTLLPAHKAITAAAQSRQLGSSQSPRSIWLSQFPPLFGMPDRLKNQSLKQSLGSLPQDTNSKRVVSVSKAFLGNRKGLIHFVGE